MGRRGPKPLDANLTALRGTLRKHRERTRNGEAASPDQAMTSQRLPGQDYLAIARMYQHDVLSGAIVACKWIRLLAEQQIRDRNRSDDPSWPFVWSDAHVTDVCTFLARLPHVEGRWRTPTIELWIVPPLFGWRHRQDVTVPRFTTLYLETGRNSAKSTLMAALALFHFIHEDEPGVSVVCGASMGSLSEKNPPRAPMRSTPSTRSCSH